MKNKVFFIAEIGINHNGDLSLAKELIDMAIDVGCDAVKFQKRNITKVYNEEFLNSYRESPWGMSQRDQKNGLELSQSDFDSIDLYCKEKGIDWFASAWDEDSVMFLKKYDLKYNKIASAMLTNKKVLEEIAKQGKLTFISTGLSTLEQIDNAVNVFVKYKCPYVLMHCVGLYPCPDNKLNLNMINTLKQRYKCPIGYSGHSSGIMDAVISYILGARYIEKHITLDRSMYGSDQSASLEKKGLEKTIEYIKYTNKALGNGKKIISNKEAKVRDKLRYWE